MPEGLQPWHTEAAHVALGAVLAGQGTLAVCVDAALKAQAPTVYNTLLRREEPKLVSHLDYFWTGREVERLAGHGSLEASPAESPPTPEAPP